MGSSRYSCNGVVLNWANFWKSNVFIKWTQNPTIMYNLTCLAIRNLQVTDITFYCSSPVTHLLRITVPLKLIVMFWNADKICYFVDVFIRCLLPHFVQLLQAFQDSKILSYEYPSNLGKCLTCLEVLQNFCSFLSRYVKSTEINKIGSQFGLLVVPTQKQCK